MPETDTSTKNQEGSSQQACSSSGLRIGGMCLNWRVLGALAALGVGIWIVAPNLIATAAPLLLLAACPLSMWLMMRGMSGGQQRGSNDSRSTALVAPDSTRPQDLAALKAEHARVTAELEALERHGARAKVDDARSPNGSKNPAVAPATRSPGAAGDDVA